MNANLQPKPVVALVATDTAGLLALRPTRDLLDTFAVGWEEKIAGPKAFADAGWRALVVASADAILPGALAAETGLPVVRVPIANDARAGLELLQDPATDNLLAGAAPFATVAIGEAGAKNAALFVVSVLGLNDPRLWAQWLVYRQRQTGAVLAQPLLDPA